MNYVRSFFFLCLSLLLAYNPSLAAKEKELPKKLLFIMSKMNIGGTERSLINVVLNYPDTTAKIYIYLLERGGALENLLLQNPQVQLIDKKTAYKLSFDVAISYAPWIDVKLWVDNIKADRRIQWIHTDNAFFRRLENAMKNNKKQYEKIDSFVCVSKIATEQFKKRFTQFKDKVHTIYNIFDNVSILKLGEEIPPDMRFDDGLPNIVTVARLAPEKCIDKAIEIHKRFEANGIHFRWYIVGEGSERPKLERLIQEAGLDGKFILLGQRQNPFKYIKSADIFALLSSSEGFGMVIAEAKVLQKPILVTNFPAAHEQITDNVNGLIVEHDLRSIYGGLEQLLLNPELREKFTKELEGFTFDNDPQYQKMKRLFFK
jgi:glycosyltransferase involved in cell wall biosynthesis